MVETFFFTRRYFPGCEGKRQCGTLPKCVVTEEGRVVPLIQAGDNACQVLVGDNSARSQRCNRDLATP